MARMKVLSDSHHRLRAEEGAKRGLEWKSAWLLKGRSLERSADILWKEVENDFKLLKEGTAFNWDSVTGPYLMMSGLAVENYLKAICVTIKGAFAQSGKFKFGHHDLLQLASDTSLAFSVEELELLERLEYHVIFAGRYPAPKNPDLLLPRVHANGSWGPLSYLSSSDQGKIKNLMGRLRNAIEAQQVIQAESASRRRLDPGVRAQ